MGRTWRNQGWGRKACVLYMIWLKSNCGEANAGEANSLLPNLAT